MAASRIDQQLDVSGTFRLSAEQAKADGDALPAEAPMQISLVSPGFPPQLGGVEVVAGQLADALRGHDHQVTVCSFR